MGSWLLEEGLLVIGGIGETGFIYLFITQLLYISTWDYTFAL